MAEIMPLGAAGNLNIVKWTRLHSEARANL